MMYVWKKAVSPKKKESYMKEENINLCVANLVAGFPVRFPNSQRGTAKYTCFARDKSLSYQQAVIHIEHRSRKMKYQESWETSRKRCILYYYLFILSSLRMSFSIVFYATCHILFMTIIIILFGVLRYVLSDV